MLSSKVGQLRTAETVIMQAFQLVAVKALANDTRIFRRLVNLMQTDVALVGDSQEYKQIGRGPVFKLEHPCQSETRQPSPILPVHDHVRSHSEHSHAWKILAILNRPTS